ncbi:MAG: SGNH hydrolase domain-containing protein [Solirubrobacteraceae bacterium]
MCHHPARVKILLATAVALALAAIGGVATAAAAAPECFGAAARDPRHPCTNPTLAVTPAPEAVDDERGVGCYKGGVSGPATCRFGAPKRKAKRHFAVVGDSHVYHWRAALAGIGKVKRWHGTSLTMGGCFFSAAAKYMYPGAREPCTEWYRSVLEWFRDHHEVSTVFVTQNADTPILPPAGKTSGAIKVAGFQRAWRALPKTVKQIVVIRDNPKASATSLACVGSVIAAGNEAPGPACPTPRWFGLRRDMAVVAAKALRSKRYQHVDLTHYFCSSRDCWPVIGGVLVNTDQWGHLTLTYSRTLAPYMLRKLRPLMRSW